MALEPSVQVVPLYGSIDTKTDPKFVPPTSTLVSQNTRFPAVAQAAKRYGQGVLPIDIIGGGVIANGTSGGIYRDEILLFDGRVMYSYSEAQQAWSAKTTMFEIDLTTSPVAAGAVSLNNPTSAGSTATTFYAWDDGTSVMYCLKDETTGAFLAPAATLATGTNPKVFSIGDYFIVLYASAGSIYGRTIPILHPLSTPSGAVLLTPYVSASDYAAREAEAYPGQILLACYAVGTDLSFLRFLADPLFAIQSLQTTAIGAALPVADVHSLAGTGVVAGESFAVLETPNAVTGEGYTLYSSGGTLVTTIPATPVDWAAYGALGANAAFSEGFSAALDPDTNIYSFYQTVRYRNSAYPVGSTTVSRDFVKTSAGTIAVTGPALAAVVTATGSQNEVYLASQTQLRDDVPYALVRTRTLNNSLAQTPTNGADYHVMYGPDCELVFRFLGLQAAASASPTNLTEISDGVFKAALPYVTALGAGSDGTIFSQTSVISVTGTFAAESRATIVPFGTTALISCGNTYSYDGSSTVENGFWQIPNNNAYVVEPAGGSLTSAASYTYQFTYEWTDVAGNFHVSTPSPAEVVVTAGTLNNERVEFIVDKLWLTLKTGVQLGVYRSTANNSVPLYREQTIDLDSVAGPFVPVSSTMSDLALQAQLPLYTNGGLGELENDPAPAFKFVVATKNRVFGIPQDNPYQLWYSKPLIAGRPAQFSVAFVNTIETAGGIPTALSYIDTQAIIFKRERIYGQPGEGPGATGQPSNGFGNLALISTVTGCSEPSTVLPTSEGLFFKSSTTMSLLTRGLSLDQKVGLPVQGLNYLTLKGAAVIPEQNQLRWVSEEGTALVFDYLLGRWSTYTNFDGVGCATTSAGLFLRFTESGQVWFEDPTTFTDNGIAIPMKVGTAWIKPGGQSQGFMAVWEAMLLGDYRSPHTLSVDIYYDYQEFPQFTLTWDPTGALNVSVYGEESPYGATPYYGSTVQFAPAYQCRITPPRQMCQAIRFVISDSGVTGESCTLNQLELKLGNVGGLNRTGALQTI